MADMNDLLAAAASAAASPSPASAPQPAQTLDEASARIQAQLANLGTSKQASITEKMAGLTPQSYAPISIADFRGTGSGLASASPVEHDLRTMNAEAFNFKYGPDASTIRDQYTSALRDTGFQEGRSRDLEQIVGDTLNSVGTGLAVTAGSLAAWGAGQIDPKLGANIAKGLGDFQAAQQARKSDVAQYHAIATDALNNLDTRDNQSQYEKDLAAGGNQILATAKREVSNFGDSVKNEVSDPTQFGEGTANAIGSLLATAPLAGPIGALGKVLLPQTARLGIGLAADVGRADGGALAARMLDRAVQAGEKYVPASLSIGALEGGGAYQQTAQDVMNMDPADLAKSSPAFQKLVAGGMSPEDARAQLAGQAGSEAAWKQAIAGVATGAMVAPFEAHPFKIGGVRTALQNTGKEALEEGLQNASGQFMQNQAEKDTGVDPAKDLFDSIGQQAGQGALYGAAAAAHVAAPGVVVGNTIRAPLGVAKFAADGIRAAAGNQTALDTIRSGLSLAQDAGKAVTDTATGLAGAAGSAVNSAVGVAAPYVSKVADYFGKRGDEIMARNEQDSPVSDETVAQAGQEVQAQATNTDALKQSINDTPDLSDDAKAKASDYLDQAAKINDLSPEQVSQMHPAAQAVVGDATSRIEAIQRMQQYVSNLKNPEENRLAVGAQLEREKADIGRFADSNPKALDGLPAEHEARAFADDAATFAKGVDASPGAARADRATVSLFDRNQEILKPLTEDSVKTPEGQANAQTLATIAEVAPQKVDPASAQIALKHASALGLNDDQRRSLKSASDMLKAAQDHFDRLEANGDKPLSAQNLVTKEVTTGDTSSPYKQSAVKHAQGITAAYRAGDLDAARSKLLDLQKFAQSQQNKLGALNSHLVTANPNERSTVHYDRLSADADRSFAKSDEGVFVNPTSQPSVRLARRVASEARFLTDLSNHLATAFPELKVDHLEHTQLDPRIAEGTVDEVVRGFKDGTRSVKSGTPSVEPQEAKQPVTKTETKDAVKETAAPVESVNPSDSGVEKPAAGSSSAKQESKPVEQPVKVEKASVEAEQKSAEPVVTEVKEEPKQGLAAVYPDLVNHMVGGNQFTNSFRPAKETKDGQAPTNIVQHERPIKGIADAVKAAVRSLPAKHSDDVFAGYRRAFNDITGIAQAMRENLATFLTEKNVGERFLNGEGKAEHAHTWLDGKVLNLVENQDGHLAYNEQLLQGAALAGMTWFLGSGQLGQVYDAQHAAEQLGIPLAAVDDVLTTRMKGSMGTVEALNSLAAKIQQYWGVRANDTAQIGYTEGIPLSMAAEVLRAMQDMGMLKSDVFWIDTSETGGLVDKPTKEMIDSKQVKSIERLTTVKLDKGDAAEAGLRAYPDLIEKAVLPEPTPTYFFDDQRPDVAREQMRNDYVKNTADQLSALKNEQNTPNFLNKTMANLYKDMGRDLVLRWFAAGDLTDRVLNVNHRATLEGQNMTIRSAYDEFTNLYAALEAHAEQTGADISDVANHYGYNMSRVGRMQTLGKYNPQSTKFIREVMLPNRATLDLTDAKHMQAFDLGLAQALGIKVHNLPYLGKGGIAQKLDGMLKGALAPAVEHFQEWLKGDAPFASGKIEDAFKVAGMDLSPLALHALTEYARFQNATEEERSNFTTTKYLEADGMTNGPINAMALLSTGPFTADWVTNMRRGGLEIGGTQENTSAQIRQSAQGAADLYQVTTDRLRNHLSNLFSSLTRQKNTKVLDQQQHLMKLMNMFMPDMEIQDGKMVIGRGVAKNPLTITIYGSGAGGIAAKLVKGMTTEIYERMSAAAALQAKAEANGEKLSDADAFFPNDPHAEARFASMMQRIDALTEKVAGYNSQDKRHYLQDKPTAGNRTQGFENFTFTPEELKNMSSNTQTLFVGPLRDAIRDTVGDLEENTKLIRQATQTQSIFMSHFFVRDVEAALNKKAEADLTFKRDAFLSAKELKQVMDELARYHPLVQTGDQSFFIAGSQNSDVDTADFGRALNGKFRMPGFVYGPANAGVAGIPYLNIGMGDGKMMQILANDPRVQRTLKIFDGMNMPLDRITEQSQAANEAVLQSWQGNPMQAVYDSYAPFLKALTKEDWSALPDAVHTELAKAMFGLSEDHNTVGLDMIEARMQEVARVLRGSALEVQARHNVMDRINLSVDQMAAAGAPHVVGGKIQINGTDKEKSIALSKMYDEELAKLRAAQKGAGEETAPQAVPVEAPEDAAANAKAVGSDKIGEQINTLGRVDKKTGARVMSAATVNRVLVKSGVAPHEQMLLNEVRKSLGAKGYKIISGTQDQLAKYAFNNSDSVALGNGVSGVTLPGSQRIYLVNPSSETVTHELIHAATFETVLAHYEGSAELSPEAQSAIGNIESLMDQFTTLDVSRESLLTQQAHADALNAIQSFSTETAIGRASALNEFMAWSLANKELADLGAKTTTLSQIAERVFQAIKQVIFGKKKVPVVPGSDMFSNLLFNSSIVMREQPSVHEALRSTALYQSTNYGNNTRLAEVNRAFNNILDTFGKQADEPDSKSTYKAQVNFAKVMGGSQALRAQAHGFPMSMQEASTFSLIAATLATQAHLDPNSMSAMSGLYQHVVKTVTVEDFMKTQPEANDQGDRYQAQQKYSTIVGDIGTSTDKQGRSSLLPTFLALAVTNDDLRSVLQKMDLPKGTKSTANSRLDAMVENGAMGAMEKLADAASGAKGNNVRETIDSLMQHVMDVASQRDAYMQQTWAGNLADTVNTEVVAGVERVADKVIDSMQQVIDDPKASKLQKNLATYAQLSARMATEKHGNTVAESVVSRMNRMNAWQPMHDLVYDFVGRTEQNAPVYDMMKAVRSEVSQDRQNYREQVPSIIAGKFSRELDAGEWSTLHRGMARTDIAALRSVMGHDEIQGILADGKKLDAAVNDLEDRIQKTDPANWNLYQSKMQQLAEHMMTGNVGKNLLRNADAISRLMGEKKAKMGGRIDPDLVEMIDHLTSLYAVERLSPTERAGLASLVQKEGAGVQFATDYLVGQRAEETRKAGMSSRAKLNAFKGYVPEETKQGVHLMVADDSRYQELAEQSYQRVADYKGSSADGKKGRMGYYFAPVSARTLFNQGIFQNVRHTAGGVDIVSGFNNSTLTGGRITDREEVARVTLNLARGEHGNELLMPVYDGKGAVVAYERSVDPKQLERIQTEQNLANQIGVWRGRQVEEAKAQEFNNALIDALHDRYENDMKAKQSKQAEYVDLFDQRYLAKDPVIADAVKLMTPETLKRIKSVFGDNFWVSKDMLHDAMGYRNASVGDFFTGNSRWSDETQQQMKRVLIGMFGNKAYQYLTNAEKTLQGFIGDAKTLIVVKSVVVPVTNMLGNALQLIGRGVPLKHIVMGAPKKIAETNAYVKGRQKQIALEAEMRTATEDVVATRKLSTQWQILEDEFKRLSIYPLIKAGEFTAISDASSVGHDDVALTSGKVHSFMEAQVEKLPKALQTAGRYALVTKDTALFKGLQKSVEYGDFIAKALLYDDLTVRQKKSSEYALSRVTEEFVNYDKLPGRFRGYLENMGLLWFYNFKIRAAKVAMSMVRNNPVHSILAAGLPMPDVFGSVGTPLGDNFFTKLLTGGLTHSFGFGQIWHAPQMNPWVHLFG